MIKTIGLNTLLAKLRKDKEWLTGRVTETHQRLVYAVFMDLTELTPQWSGNLASNWQIEFHSYSAKYRELPGKGTYDFAKENKLLQEFSPYMRGDDPAVSIARDRELWKIPNIRWNSIVTITNPTPYAEDVEMNMGPNGSRIRPENMYEAYGGVAMVGFVEMKYKQLRVLKSLPKVPR